jgi:hypothetical protein
MGQAYSYPVEYAAAVDRDKRPVLGVQLQNLKKGKTYLKMGASSPSIPDPPHAADNVRLQHLYLHCSHLDFVVEVYGSVYAVYTKAAFHLGAFFFRFKL